MSRLYPDHIYDQQRIAMAAEVTQKELRKLLPAVPNSLWPAVDDNVLDWFDGKASELAPVHDFWNGCEGITQGFKLKRLVRYISAETIDWKKTELVVDEVSITWGFPSLKALGRPPYTAAQIREEMARNVTFRTAVEAGYKKHAAPERDHYPIIVSEDDDGKRTLLDGNRRTHDAIMRGQSKITAYLGTINRPPVIHNYWISTPFLRNLVRVAETANDAKVTNGIEMVLRQLFDETEIAAINYRERVCNQSELAQQLYLKLTK